MPAQGWTVTLAVLLASQHILLVAGGRLRRPFPTLFTRAASSSIPRIIHQSWKTKKVPKKFRSWQQSWKDLHPDWQYILWTDRSNRQLAEDHFRWFLQIYDSFPAEILRADSARYMYLYQFGGVYADLDFRALKPMDALLRGSEPKALLGRLSDDDNWPQNIPNAWMASSPGHPFWLFCLLEIARGSTWVQCQGSQCTKNYIVERTTGPWMLWRAVQHFEWYRQPPDGELTIFQPHVVYPLNWRGFDGRCSEWQKNESGCYELFPDSYAITYWSHGWADG